MREAKLMIFSSVESLRFAKELKEELSQIINTIVWDEFFFPLHKHPLDFFEEIKNKDFAIVLYSSEDYIRLRKKIPYRHFNNLSFELGLMIGKLGRDRVFILDEEYENKSLLIPSDLMGIKYFNYRSNNFPEIIGRIKSTILKTSQKDELFYPEEFRSISNKLEKYITENRQINLTEGHFYTDTNSNKKAHNLYKAFIDIIDEVGIDIILNYKEEKGSWLKRFIGGIKNNEELNKKLEEAEHAIKLAAIDKVQSEIDKNQSESAANLSEAAKDVDSCVFKIGSLLYVKYIDPNGKKIIQCKTLTRSEMIELDKNPELLNSPEKILKLIEGKEDAT